MGARANHKNKLIARDRNADELIAPHRAFDKTELAAPVSIASAT